MTPTREQVIEWAEEAGITSDDAACQIHDLTQLARLAMSAGRDQGLREAGACADLPGVYTQHDMQAAIEQLRGK